MNLRPMLDRIIVEPDGAEDVTPGGIIIPDQAKKTPTIGTVLAVGPGRHKDGFFVEPKVIEGDRVLYAKFGGFEIEHEGKELRVLAEPDIFAVIE